MHCTFLHFCVFAMECLCKASKHVENLPILPPKPPQHLPNSAVRVVAPRLNTCLDFSLRLTNTTTFFALDRLWTSKKHTTTAMSEHKAAGCATFPFAVTTKPSYASLRPGTLLQEPVVASASPFNTSLLCSPDSRLNPRVARGVPPPRRR